MVAPMSRLVRALLFLAAAVAAVLALAWLLQRRLLYFPDRSDRASAEARARRLGLEPWTSAGGELLGWRLRSRGARGRLVVFHGNAGSALDRTYVAAALAQASPALPLDVYLAEYPGYGPRPGEPSEPALLAAAREALAEARREGTGPLLVAGESLGSAVAALAAAADPRQVDGVALVTPLASLPAVARRHYPLVPAALVRDTWRTDLALGRYRGPVAFVIAGRDEIVFADLGVALHDAYPGPKAMWVDPGATHNAVDWRPGLARWRELVEFLAARR
jgi:pimeloyl-ACP methyl ester carboxylesterase